MEMSLYCADDPYLYDSCATDIIGYIIYNIYGCAHEQKTHGLQWVELIDVANKNIAFVMFVGLAKRFQAQ
jgi:hypothetical protein